MGLFNDYLLNILISVFFMNALQKILDVQMLNGITDFIVMSVMVIISRLISDYLRRFFKRLIINVLRKKKNDKFR